jgi:inner membrane protein
MFIAHLPAGYLLARRAPASVSRGALLFGSVAPDLDMVWWALVDHGRIHHHRYVTHLPAVWIAVLLVSPGFPRRARVLVGGLAIGMLLHAALDTVAGDIAWLWPVDDRFFSLVTVPARGGHWVWSFVLHPVFLIEIAIVTVAVLTAWRARHPRVAPPPVSTQL